MQKENEYKSEKDYYRRSKRENKDYVENIPCWECKKLIKVIYAEPMERLYCSECYDNKLAEHKKLIKEYAKLKAKVTFENAIRTMEKSESVYMHEYSDECREVYDEFIASPTIYRSSYEIIVAIMLKAHAYEFEPNYKIDKYRTDFYIPEMKVLLEVDGDRHTKRMVQDNERDIALRNIMGAEWEVIHIPTQYIEKNPEKIFDMIEGSIELKRKFRNSSLIKPIFSRREQEHYKAILNAKR